MKCRIRQGIFRAWYIVHPIADDLAWSGSRWVRHAEGLPTEGIQVCNFRTQREAEEYADLYLWKNPKS